MIIFRVTAMAPIAKDNLTFPLELWSGYDRAKRFGACPWRTRRASIDGRERRSAPRRQFSPVVDAVIEINKTLLRNALGRKS
jgi:hypothetical protein